LPYKYTYNTLIANKALFKGIIINYGNPAGYVTIFYFFRSAAIQPIILMPTLDV